MTTIDLDVVEIKHGSHSKPEDGACVMEWVSIFAGLPFGDHPECTDPVVAQYARSLNDAMPDDQRWRLRPFIPQLAATKNGCPPAKRALLCADYAVRVFAVAALKDAGLDEWADRLAALEPITTSDAASAAAWAAWAARAAAWDARAAAWDAARAAWDAARAASDAARAASDAASAASAASAAARAARAAAWDAASDPWMQPLELLAALIALKE